MSSNSPLPFKTEPLSRQERNLLRKRMVGTWIFGSIIATFAGYFLFGGFWDLNGMETVVIIFSVFFFGILGFILFVHTRNAFQTEKRIYDGQITDKKADASVTRGSSSSQEEYLIALNGHWFRVEPKRFNEIHVGDQVEVYTLGKNQVFKIEKKQTSQTHSQVDHTNQQKQTNLFSIFPNVTAVVTNTEKRILKKYLFKAIFYRTVLGFCGGYILYIILNIALLFSVSYKKEYFIHLHYSITILLVIAYLFLNRRTLRLILDFQSGEKEMITEKIIDLVKSDHIKPGPLSMIVSKNAIRFEYNYIQTETFWLLADQKTFENASVGKKIQISRGIKSHVVLGFEL